MNVDDLTFGQARELAKMFGQPAQNGNHPSVGRYCVVRSYAAGVHVGIVHSVTDSASGREVCLRDTRRIWSWQGALSCTEISALGITGGKISIAAAENFINQVVEIIPAKKGAEQCLRELK